jgi:hypothetical protein
MIDVATLGLKLKMEVPVRQMLPDLPAPGRSEAGPGHVLSPTRNSPNGVNVYDRWGGRRPDLPS